MADTPDPNKMVFTNRNEDGKGYGVLSITHNDPSDFQATIHYTPLSLGSSFDDFDVNEAVEVVVVPYEDTHYAFVAGHNYRALGLGLPGWNGKGNIGIIKDALSDNPQLVAGTRSLPEAQVNGVALSGDGKALYAAYPGLESTFVFDVEQMLATASNPSHWEDLRSQPIEELNPNIFLAGRLKTTENPITGERRYEVDPDDPLAPITTDGEDYSVTVASTVDVVSLNAAPGDDLTPTLTWDFEEIDEDDISEINVFVSTFEEGEGLFPGDNVVNWWDFTGETVGSSRTIFDVLNVPERAELLTRDWNGYDDFNPGRILTATWRDGQWYGYDGSTPLATSEGAPPNTATQLTLPDDRQLTAGQTYHWAVQALDKTGKILDEDVEQLSVHPLETTSPFTFSSVTVLTHGFRLPTAPEGIPDNIYNLAGNIASAGGDGLIMRYNSDTGEWDAIDESGAPRPNVEPSSYLGQPLVLLPDWSEGSQSHIPDSGFSEAAADVFFAALVDLDRSLGGDAELDVTTGEYVTQHGKVFDSPLHFIGFSRGTVVNSEMIQRLGKHFPEAGGAMGSGVRDLQMTTIDPHDFEQPSLSFAGFGFPTFYEPEIQVWENVTFADNYYQTVPKLRNNLTGTPAGRAIPDADLNVFLGGTVQSEVSGNVRREDSRAGFTRETDAILGLGRGAVHGRTVSWYDGTVDLSETEAPDALYRRLGDSFHEHLFDPELANNSEFESGLANPWYVPDHTAANFALEDESAPHEGIGTGWFYSVLGGGKDLRPEARLDRR
ncbi:hypothetical protein [Baaleninema simplex]|uniref:hypothetical protein n=1 Tax=Baaleninema simplex TaxID=2862350 RepID=UPI00034A0498|nr:hypothetical protein [Baaleninema simplex]